MKRLSAIHNVQDVAAWQLCCGCGACAYICPDEIEMIDTLEYGRRPRLKDGASGERGALAMKVCPGIELERKPKPEGQLGGKRFFDVWGPVSGVWEGHAADPQIRFAASSGGAATALALYAMEKRKMAGTLHVRSRVKVPYLNETVLSATRDELLAGVGSRYAPASPCEGLDLIENAHRPCVFIGKPCDVAAAQKAMELRPGLREKVGLTIAFFCAGTPATQGTLEMLRQMGIEDPASVVSLRYRGRGWPGMATVEYKENGQVKSAELTYERSWGDILQKYRQWRCYICPDHTGEYADIAVADAWHCSAIGNQPGLSVIIARTVRGKEIIEQAVHDGCIEAKGVSHEILPLCRPGHATYQGQLWARVQTLKAMLIPTPDYQRFPLFQLWMAHLSFGQKIRSVLSTVKRVFVKRLYKSRSMVPYSYCSIGEKVSSSG